MRDVDDERRNEAGISGKAESDYAEFTEEENEVPLSDTDKEVAEEENEATIYAFKRKEVTPRE